VRAAASNNGHHLGAKPIALVLTPRSAGAAGYLLSGMHRLTVLERRVHAALVVAVAFFIDSKVPHGHCMSAAYKQIRSKSNRQAATVVRTQQNAGQSCRTLLHFF
jgi:hypothetical protein